jgi:adenosylmethionine-8-amino-7-oxononanoate aminotransferase
MSNESQVFQRVISEKAPILSKADGMYITIEDPTTGEERTIIDAMTGAAVGSLGHGDADIINAMTEAAKTSNYAFGLYLGNRASEELSKFMIEHSPKDHFASCLWVGSGSEANENAMKIIKQYYLEKGDTKRYRFISRKNAYHGFTIGSLSIGDGIRKVDFKDILLSEEQTPKVSACYPFRGVKEGVTEEQYTKLLLDELEQKFIDCDPSTVAGVFFETVGGSSFGTVPPPKGYLDGAKAICEKYGALLCLDEVMVGLGRNGKYHAYESFMESGSGPDLMTIGKTIGSGYVTLAGVMISPKVKNAVVEGSNKANGAQTYHCHEFNCAVGLAVQKKLWEQDLFAKGGAVGEYMMEQIAEKTKDSKVVGDIRGLPLFFSLEFCDPKTKEFLEPKFGFAYKVQDKCLENGITTMSLQGTAGSTTDAEGNIVALGDHISIAPAYIITKKEADIIIDALVKSISEVEAEYFASH